MSSPEEATKLAGARQASKDAALENKSAAITIQPNNVLNQEQEISLRQQLTQINVRFNLKRLICFVFDFIFLIKMHHFPTKSKTLNK